MPTSVTALSTDLVARAGDSGVAERVAGGLLLAVVAIGVAALVTLFVAALVSVVRSPGLSRVQRLGWVAVLLVLQLVGPLLWFAVGRPVARQTATRPTSRPNSCAF